MEDLFRSLFNGLVYGLGGGFVALLFVYISFRVGAMAVLKSVEEYHRRQAMQKETRHGIQVSSSQ